MNFPELTLEQRLENDKWMAACEAMSAVEVTSDDVHADIRAARDELIAQGLAASVERVESLLRLSAVLLASVANSLAHHGASKEETVFAFAQLVVNAGVEEEVAMTIVHLKNGLEEAVAASRAGTSAASGERTE